MILRLYRRRTGTLCLLFTAEVHGIKSGPALSETEIASDQYRYVRVAVSGFRRWMNDSFSSMRI
jgi:hypothetical protein